LENSTNEIMQRYAEPFARALAVFVQELSKSDAAGPMHRDAGLTGSADASSEGDDEALMEELARAIEENDALQKAGKLEVIEINQDTASKTVAARLRWIIRDRGLTQKQLAQKIGVTPARISHVLRNPDRSKVDTLRKIACALDIDLRQIF